MGQRLHKLTYAKCLGQSGNPGDSESETFMVSDVLCRAWQILHFHSHPTTYTAIPSTSSTNPNMHFKAGKQGSLLNHNRHFAAHSLFIASINMEKPRLNSPAMGSPLMLTAIMVILVPGITGCPHLCSQTRYWEEIGNGNRTVVKSQQWVKLFEATTVSQRAFTVHTMGLKAVWPPQWEVRYNYVFSHSGYWQEKQTPHVPKTVAGNSLLQLPPTPKRRKNSSLMMTHKKKLEGDMAQMVSASGWIKYAAVRCRGSDPGRAAHNYTTIRHWSTYSSNLPEPGRGRCPLIKATLNWCLCVCMSGDNYRRTRQIMSWAPAMHKSHKQGAIDSGSRLNLRLSRGTGAKSTNNEYLSPALCVPLMCK